MKWIDLPPIWLLAAIAIAYIGRGQITLPLSTGLAVILIATGGGLMLAAVRDLRRHRTTVIPHKEPSNLVTTGAFAISRNPIYLGDALILLGLSWGWGSVYGLAMVPVFVWIIQVRFIGPEERRLLTLFPHDFATYCHEARRWI